IAIFFAAFFFSELPQEKAMLRLLGLALWDILIGIQLLRNRDGWRKFALIRAAFSAMVFGIGRAIVIRETGVWIDGVFQIFFAGGIFILLYGKPPSRSRIRLGVAAIVFTLISLNTFDLVWSVIPETRTENQLKEWI